MAAECVQLLTTLSTVSFGTVASGVGAAHQIALPARMAERFRRPACPFLRDFGTIGRGPGALSQRITDRCRTDPSRCLRHGARHSAIGRH